MKCADTSLGGPRAEFPPTNLGLIARLQDPTGTAFNDFCRLYWKPVYRYFRVAWAKPNETAKDLTQGFLLWLLEDGDLQRYEPDRGSLRRFLKLLLAQFLIDHDRTTGRMKRGGEIRFLRIEMEDEGLEEKLPDPRSLDPEREFDQAWREALLKQAIDRVRQRFTTQGRPHQLRAFEEYDMSGEPRTYAEVAARIGAKESDVRNWLFAVRDAIREEIESEIRRQAPDATEYHRDARDFFAS